MSETFFRGFVLHIPEQVSTVRCHTTLQESAYHLENVIRGSTNNNLINLFQKLGSATRDTNPQTFEILFF